MTIGKDLSFRDIPSVLERDGWKHNREAEDEKRCECKLYEMTFSSLGYDVTVRTWISVSDEGIELEGHYGVCTFEVVKCEDYEFPFSPHEIKAMNYAIELAEEKLIEIGIPFSPDYRFSELFTTGKLDRNYMLRKKYKLLQDEREAWRRRLARFEMTPEEIEEQIANRYPDEP